MKLAEFVWGGHTVHYVDEGAGDPLFLLPGNTASSAVLIHDIAYWATSFRVICPDYLGYGKSARVEPLPTDFWWQSAGMLAELAKALGLSDALVIGTSGGGIIGLNLAIQAPRLVRGAVADSFAGEYLSVNQAEAVYKERETRTNEQAMFWQFAHGSDWGEVIDRDTAMLLRAAESGESFFKGRLGEIRCQVLLTGSLGDELIPDLPTKMLAVAKQIATARTLFYSSGSHPSMWSRADEFRREVQNFFAECRRRL